MSIKVFNVNFEFDKNKFEEIVTNTSLEGKGYACFVDLTSLSTAYKDENFLKVLNNSLVNSCDGSYIALMASKIHKTNFQAYIGPDFFEKMVTLPFRQIMIGGDKEVFSKIEAKVMNSGGSSALLSHLELPFADVNDFDYKYVADQINKFEPRFIWVSLGAPKQEIFMNKLLPFINKGVLIGVGAAFNYYTGTIKEIPKWARKTKLIWFYRLLTEPQKQSKRFFTIMKVLPKLYKEEKYNFNSQK